MLGLFGSKNSTRRNSYAALEEAVENAGRVWDTADVEKRVELLEKAKRIEDDRMFLAFVHVPWSQLPESTRLGIFEVLAKRDTEDHFVKTAARHMGGNVADSYSEAEFDALFGNQEYDENWSRERALGVWYGLGRFCLFISIGQLQRLRERDYETAVNAGEDGLLSRWKMSDATRKSYERFGALKIPLILQMYREIDDREKLRLFFLVVMSEMLGHETTVSTDDFSGGYLALVLRGVRMDVELTILSRVSSMFGRVKEAAQVFDKMLPI